LHSSERRARSALAWSVRFRSIEMVPCISMCVCVCVRVHECVFVPRSEIGRAFYRCQSRQIVKQVYHKVDAANCAVADENPSWCATRTLFISTHPNHWALYFMLHRAYRASLIQSKRPKPFASVLVKLFPLSLSFLSIVLLKYTTCPRGMCHRD